MAKAPDFDVAAAHTYFSAECFNKAWDLIDKPDRTPEENEAMIQLSIASTWHWTQRADCAPTNLSVGYWQTSRIYALLGQADNARHYGQLSLGALQGDDVPPFHRGYAYEALARAESIAGNKAKTETFLAEARRAAEAVTDAGERQMLLADLNTIR